MRDYFLRINSDLEYSTITSLPTNIDVCGTTDCGRFIVYSVESDSSDNTVNDLVSDILRGKYTGDYIIGINSGNREIRGFCTEMMATEYMSYMVSEYNLDNISLSHFSNMQ